MSEDGNESIQIFILLFRVAHTRQGKIHFAAVTSVEPHIWIPNFRVLVVT